MLVSRDNANIAWAHNITRRGSTTSRKLIIIIDSSTCNPRVYIVQHNL